APAGPDHQTFGGGPYNNSAIPAPPPHPLYPNAIYYCSQNIVGGAECSRSDNGGLTFGPGVDIFPPTQCYGGIHGHVKVSPDGTVYVPNSSCTSGNGGSQGVAISRDNGITWIDSTVPGSTGSGDPSVGIDADNKVYIGYVNADGRPHIAVSSDHGARWTKDWDVGVPVDCNAAADPNPAYAVCRVKSSVFPVVVAGDKDRAAFGFLGSTTGGNYQEQATYQGIWHFYVATTFDGGNTWTTVNATPGDPVQKGSICLGGLTCGDDRNLLDFNDISIDREGRVLAAYADGCVASAGCVAPDYNGRLNKAAIVRQSSGRRMFAAFDPNPSPTPTPSPSATPAPTGPQTFQGTYDPHPYPCATARHHFNVPAGMARIVVQVNATVPTNDLSVSLLFGSDPNPVLLDTEDTGTCCEALLYQPAAGVPAGEYQVQICQTPTPQGVPQQPPYDYVGTFTADSTLAPGPTPTPISTPTPVPITPVYEKGGLAFSPNVALRASATGRDGEPSLRVDKFGNAYVAGIRGVPAGVDLWYFDLNPSSLTYDPLMRNQIYRGQPDQFSPDEAIEVGADGGGDVDLAVGFDEASPGNPPFLAFSSLTAANISTARSTDRGATFTKNPAGNVTGGVPADDRQWMEFYGKDSVYLLYRSLEPVIAWVQRSNDGGLTYGAAREVGTIGQVGGISVDQNDGTVYISGKNGVVAVGAPQAPGMEPLTYTIHEVADSNNGHIFFTVKAAQDGTVYACYSDGTKVFVKYSRDKGNTWSQAVRISDGPETVTSVLPWMETGPTPGSIGVVWYGTTASSNNDNADWKVFFAQSLNVTDANPVIRQVTLSDHFIHGSNISEEGLPLLPGEAPNRNLLDYFQIGFDPTGAAVVAYTDDHNDFDGHVYVARQISGPGVRGTNIPAPVNGSALPQPTPRPVNAPQVIDYPQDQKNGLLTILPVNDPLDILSVKYSTEGPATAPVLVTTMKVSDLSIVPPLSNWRMNFTANAPDSRMSPTGDYSFGLSDRGDQFFLRATTDALGARTYTYGTAVREHQHRGFVAYTDRGAADSGSFDSAAGLITIKVSLTKLNATLASGHTPIGPGSILAGLRGGTFTTGDDNAADRNDRAKSDMARGGIQYAINSAPTALLSAVPTSGTAPLAVNFDGSCSTDPDPGDTLTYTFNFGDGSAAITQGSPVVKHTYNTAGSYTASLKVKDAAGWESNTATVSITVNTPPPPVSVCYEDDDSHIAYSSGWHLVNTSSASGGHFRLHNGRDTTHFASLTFDVPSGLTGFLTYTFAKSTKGGSAEVFIDNVSKGVISYNGPNGGMRDPEFTNAGIPYSIKYVGLAPGQHKFELRNLTDAVYFDRVCVESASSNSEPTAGPGQTSSSSSSINTGQQSSTSLSAPSNTTAISVLAEASVGLPIKLLLVDPTGLTLKTVDSTNGVAVLNSPVSGSGLYTIKVVNVSLGPVQVWTVATPFVTR
ncbi:MAG: PKD domain-containing protein, partial [Pyrinomonadaceae bacterium]